VKFLVDVGVGKGVEIWLEEAGYDVLSMRKINCRAQDIEILRLAVEEQRMILTMDKDFGDLVYNSGMPHAGVLLLRLENATGEQKAEIVKKIIRAYSDKITGNFCVFQEGKLRIKT
jgi:predicted nuclease of predicted toxin-antitoxin system